jgi:hypothetical protein
MSGPADLEGRRGAPFEITVEAGKVREFARATGSANPAYLSGDYPVSPATFLVTATFSMNPEHSPWGEDRPDLARVLHGGQTFTFTGSPPLAGARLVGVQRIDRIYAKQGRRGGAMHFYELVTEYRDLDDTAIAEVRSTLIVTAPADANSDSAPL